MSDKKAVGLCVHDGLTLIESRCFGLIGFIEKNEINDPVLLAKIEKIKAATKETIDYLHLKLEVE